MNTLEQLQSGALAGATRVAIACGLETFPRELFGLTDTLQALDLSGNHLAALPDDFGDFAQLRILFCSFNDFTRLPDVLGQCPQLEMIGFRANRISEVPAASLPRHLRWLILTGNCIESLPDQLGQCTSMQKLMLAGNRLQTLPESLRACERLELLRLSANRFEGLPGWLLRLPRLSWLAFSGNPCSDALERRAQGSVQAPTVRWDHLEIGEILGSGASGVIHRAVWRQGSAARDVAVKVFKGAMTSDGLPHSEMVAWLAAGTHAGLIGALGRVEGHPDNAEALVMPLVDASFTVLASPPSMQTCTRDVYDPGLRLAPQAALRLASDVAGAAAQLHARGILHGDLYAHNILHNQRGDAFLGDFGAATFCAPDQGRDNPFESLDVRAFGCLLEELVERIQPQGHSASIQDKLAALRDVCLQPDARARPSFRDLCESLAKRG